MREGNFVARENERNARVVPPGLISFLARVPRTSSWAKFFAVPFGTQMLGALAFGSLAGLKPGLYIDLLE